jgi:transposase-like protein
MNAKARLGWVKLYEQIGHAGIVCRRCGISAPTLRKWWRRYQAEDDPGLSGRHHKPPWQHGVCSGSLTGALSLDLALRCAPT